MKQNMTPTEDSEQAALFAWAERAACTTPELHMLYAIPNGGLRSKVTAARLKATGVKAGIPDICLPVARGGYFGLFLEMKRVKGGKVSEAQKEWMANLNEAGYLAIVCYGWEEAQKMIVQYLAGPWTPKTEG